MTPKTHITHPKSGTISQYPRKIKSALRPSKRPKSPRNLTVISLTKTNSARSHDEILPFEIVMISKCQSYAGRIGRAGRMILQLLLYMRMPVPSIENDLSCNNVKYRKLPIKMVRNGTSEIAHTI